ncbi:MAG: DUF5687 family protein [Cyclobacteriaceae bacterium]|jgi:hypothetical protein|nr:DUF5687 family protein [Cyclobacteriaceae bacterium]
MITTLLSHEWKRLARSASAGKELATTVLLGLVALMMLTYALMVGFFLDTLITQGLGQPDSFAFLNRFLIYYFFFEFVMRYFVQSVPALDAQPYLHLPIRRSTLIHYLLGKSLVHVFNVLVLLLFGPFALTTVWSRFGAGVALSWFALLWVLSLVVHYKVMLFKKRLDDTAWGLLALLGSFGLLGAADYYAWFRLTDVSAWVFGEVARLPWVLTISGLAGVAVYGVNYRVFQRGLYVDQWQANTASGNRWGRQEFGFLKAFGAMGDWISLELKLILRHKRTRSILIMSGLFLFYGLFFYRQEDAANQPGLILFGGILITGIFMMNYGQFLFSWQAGHFDFTLTRPLSLRQYVESKYWLLGTVTLGCFLLTIPYVYYGWEILAVQVVSLLFNLGVNVFVMMNMAMWSPKRVNLTKGGTLNYEGVGAAQWLMGLPVLLGPYVFYLPFSLAGYPFAGLWAVGAVGVLGIALRPYLLTMTAHRLAARKYSMAAGFRHE